MEAEEKDEVETAYRETKEETKLLKKHLKVFKRTKRVLYYKSLHPKKVTYFLARLKDITTNVKISKDHQAYKWCSLEEACDLVDCYEMSKTLQYYDFYIREYVNL